VPDVERADRRGAVNRPAPAPGAQAAVLPGDGDTDNRLMSQVTLSSEFHRLAAEFGYGWPDVEW